MIKLRFLSFFLFSALLFSCQTDEATDSPPIEPVADAPAGIKEALAFEYLVHDIEGIIFNMFHSLHDRDKGEANTHTNYNLFTGRGACASQSLEADINKLTLDFSVGCSDDNGRIRKGIIEINYSDPKNDIGNVMQVYLNQFYLNSLGFQGSLRIENISSVNSEHSKQYSISFSGLELFINTEVNTFTGNRQITFEKVDGNQFETTQMNYLTDNSLSYELQNGKVYELNTPSATIQAFKCWLGGTFLPISGRQVIEGENGQVTIDYYTAGCNHTLSIESEGQNAQVFDLSDIL